MYKYCVKITHSNYLNDVKTHEFNVVVKKRGKVYALISAMNELLNITKYVCEILRVEITTVETVNYING